MRRPALSVALLFVARTVAQYTCPATTCVSTYDEFPELLSKEPWESRVPRPAYSSGNFTCPQPADWNRSRASDLDFSKNERVFVGDNYTVQWTHNATKNVSWDLYLVNERYERYFLHNTFETVSSTNTSLGRYLWLVRENKFVRSGAMYFFYVARKDGFWSEGFASRYVNVSRAEEKGLTVSKMTSETIGIGTHRSGALMPALALLVLFWVAFSL